MEFAKSLSSSPASHRRIPFSRPRYQYDELRELPGRFFIRVFNLEPGSKHEPIRGHLRQIELPLEPETHANYAALSYTWGSKDDVQHEILIADRLFQIRDNLYMALVALRHEFKQTTLWIDAICINQAKVHEKNHQVSMMSKIYRMAETTKIWLGAASIDSARAFEFINMRNFQAEDETDMTDTSVLDAFRALLVRPYWYRAWILQEVFLSFQIDVHCGTMFTTWESFSAACCALRRELPEHILDEPVFHLLNQRSGQHEEHHHLSNQTLESLIRNHSKAMAQDVRDKIFALLSLAVDHGTDSRLQVDYNIPRFHLLLEVLSFCQPNDPLGFGQILFDTLELEHSDDSWANASRAWREFVGLENEQPMSSSVPKWLTTIDFFTAKRFPMGGDSVSHERCSEAFTILDVMQSGKSPIWELSQGVRGRRQYDRLVGRLNEETWLVVQDRSHIALLSKYEMSAVVNPCSTLKLHPDTEKCTREHCSEAYRILKFSSSTKNAQATKYRPISRKGS